MAKKNPNGTYEYKTMSIYFDISNPYQKEAYELLQKIQKKKSLFLGMLAHEFVKQFKDVSDITSDDLKNYIQYYELMNKMDNYSSPMTIPQTENPIRTPVSTAPVTEPIPKVMSEPLPVYNQNEQVVNETTKAMPKSQEYSVSENNVADDAPSSTPANPIDKRRAMAALNFFTAS